MASNGNERRVTREGGFKVKCLGGKRGVGLGGVLSACSLQGRAMNGRP